MINISPFGSFIAYLFAGIFILSGGAASISYSPFDWLAAVSSSAHLINFGFALSLMFLAVYIFFSSAIFESYLAAQKQRNTLRWRSLTTVGLARRLLVANLWLSIVIFPNGYGVFLLGLYGTLLLSHRLLHWGSNVEACGSDKNLWGMDAFQALLIVAFILYTQAAATAPTIEGPNHRHFIELARIVGFLESGFYLHVIMALSLLYLGACVLVTKWKCFLSFDFYVASCGVAIAYAAYRILRGLPSYTERVPNDSLGNALLYWQLPISTGDYAFIAALLLFIYLVLVSLSIWRLFNAHNALNVLRSKQ